MRSTLILFIASLITFVGCTKNERARKYGGKETISLPQGRKLVMITWKEDDIWYLTKPMSKTDSVETYTFQEKSSYGVWEGTITVNESR